MYTQLAIQVDNCQQSMSQVEFDSVLVDNSIESVSESGTAVVAAAGLFLVTLVIIVIIVTLVGVVCRRGGSPSWSRGVWCTAQTHMLLIISPQHAGGTPAMLYNCIYSQLTIMWSHGIYIYIYFVLREYGWDLSSFATKERHIDVCCIRSFITLASKQ